MNFANNLALGVLVLQQLFKKKKIPKHFITQSYFHLFMVETALC